mmetsp:Transcript_15927/g.36729  ORF Transcript_15927/g.36729 Transcript_15927/m.36729 type:complete len:137 (-) Transcript_15927:325-735(-)
MLAVSRLSRRGHNIIRHTSLSANHRWMSAVVNLSDLDAVTKFRNINSKSVVYLTATWCPPCKMISPIYDELSKDDAFHQVAFGKVDVDENQEAAIKFEVSAVPTFVFSNNGTDVVNKFSGADKEQLKTLLTDLKNS